MTIDMPRAGDIPALRQLWKQAFGDSDSFLDSFFRTGFSPRRCRCLKTDGQLAAALYWFDCRLREQKIAYLYAVATDKAFQKKGLCRTLMENTHRHLMSLGYAAAALVPGSPELFGLYEKLGYRSFCPMQTCTVEAGEAPVPLQPIDAAAFEDLRRQLLPDNALLQEGDTTAFLATFTEFYTGRDALMCVSRENNSLCFQEYLGDTSLLPGIIAALGAQKGTVRLFGSGGDTAMYRSLDGIATPPSYLGICLN